MTWTRREWLLTALAMSAPPSAIAIPLNRVTDTRARLAPEAHGHFWRTVWPEAARALHRGGIELECVDTAGAIKFSAADRPIIEGLDRAKLNLVLTGRIPMLWDQARNLAGVTTIYDRATLSMIALNRAHTLRVPFIDTNTVVHELLHAMLGDVLVRKPGWYQASEREMRADAYATRLALFGDGFAVRAAAARMVLRLRREAAQLR